MKQGKRFFTLFFTAALFFAAFTAPVSAQTFSDVPDSQWYTPYVYDLTEQGVINGVTPTQFVPEGNITRGQFVKILAYASGDDLSPYDGAAVFNDCKNHWSKKNINWAYENGIVNGISPSEFAPESQITRQQMAAMIYRYADAQDLYLPETTAAKHLTGRISPPGPQTP